MPFLWFTPAAYRALTALPAAIRQQVLVATLALQQVPRPPGCLKMEDADTWRIRVGDYRIVYLINDTASTVTITAIAHRRDVYR